MAAMKSEHHCIQGNYSDHSFDIPATKEDFKVLQSYSQTRQDNYDPFSGAKSPGRKGGEDMNFTLKLHKLLENAEKDGLEDVISWKIHGRAFSVNNSEDFFTRIMPLYFLQTQLRSFFRQLNIYGFRRITKGYDKGAYYHELFLRGKPFLTSRILRQKIKGVKVRGLLSSETEPDFYSMPYVMGNPSFLALALTASPTLGNDELLLTKPSSTLQHQFPSLLSLPEKESVNSSNFHHLLQPEINLHEDEVSVHVKTSHLPQTQCKKNLHKEDDSDFFSLGSSLYENSESDFSFLDDEVSCTLLLEEQEKSVDLFENKQAVEDTLVLNDQFDDPVQHYSSHECNILYSLLQDITD